MTGALFEEGSFTSPEQDSYIFPLVEFSDDLLIRVFSFVLGPLEHGQYCVNNTSVRAGIKLKYEHFEPTHLLNFEHIITLAQVSTQNKNCLSIDVYRLTNNGVNWCILHLRSGSWSTSGQRNSKSVRNLSLCVLMCMLM